MRLLVLEISARRPGIISSPLGWSYSSESWKKKGQVTMPPQWGGFSPALTPEDSFLWGSCWQHSENSILASPPGTEMVAGSRGMVLPSLSQKSLVKSQGIKLQLLGPLRGARIGWGSLHLHLSTWLERPSGARAGQVKCKELSHREKPGGSSFHLSEA